MGGERGWVGEGKTVRGREGRREVERQFQFILFHQNDSALNNSEDGNKIMSEIHFLLAIL